MPIFKKDSKDKSKKKIQDRFMRRALNAKLPDSKSGEILEYEFTDAFAENKLKVIGKVTSRFVLGRGEFDKLYQKSKTIARNYTRYISGDDDPTDQLVTEMIKEFKELEKLALTWLESSEAKWSNKDEEKKDRITQIKEIEARGMLKGARVAIFQLENRSLLSDPATKQLVTNLEDAGKRLNAPDKTSKDLAVYRAADTELLVKVCGTSTPSNGTSDVKLIKGPDGDVAYAFKSVDGESEMMGTPKGFATAREVMMSSLCNNLKTKYGLDFPWPKATMATVGGKSGALIDGVQGTKPGGTEIPKESIPAEVMQKILLCNLAGGQFDIKWEDVRLVRNGDTLQATCMDGGAAMPDSDTAINFLAGLSDGKPGLSIIDNGDPSTNGYFLEAQKPISRELVKQFMSIKTADLKADMESEAKQLEKDHKLSFKGLGLESGIKNAITSIEGIQKILTDTKGNITLVDLMSRYYDEVIQKKFVEPNLPAWNKKQLDECNKLVAVHGELFSPVPPNPDIADLYRKLLHPEVKDNLKQLIELAKPKSVADMLKMYGREVPITSVGIGIVRDVLKIQEMISKGLPEYEKAMQKYPGLIVPKDSFASLEDAYREVLDNSQTYGLNQLKEVAQKLSDEEGKTVTIADVLQRYGYKVPTSGFRRIWKEISAKRSSEPTTKT